MNSYLIDINVWLAMSWDLHPQHSAASRWHVSIRNSANNSVLMFCRFTMVGLLRLLTNRMVMGDSTTTLEGALRIYDRWRQDPSVDLAPELRATESFFRQALELHAHQSATKAIADCYLVGFAEAASARLVTFDKGLAATAKLRRVGVALLAPFDGTPPGVHAATRKRG